MIDDFPEVPEWFERAVRARVDSGAHGSSDEVLHACLEALENKEMNHRFPRTDLREAISAARWRLDDGERVP